MLKALFKKQFLETLSRFTSNKKKGKSNPKKTLTVFVAIYLLLFISIGISVFASGILVCDQLKGSESTWVYFSIMSVASVTIGVFGSVFTTYSTLYLARDNDFLLSLPIPTHYIVLTRLFIVWFWSALYELVLMLPALLAYWITVSMSSQALLGGIVMIISVSVFTTTLTCLLGWVVAKISTVVKHKAIVTTILSLAFIAAYYVFYFNADAMLDQLVLNIDKVGDTFKSYVYPLYMVGRACEGDILCALALTAVTFVLFAGLYALISKGFIKTATVQRANSTSGGKAKIKTSSANTALLKKELRRFTGSSVYLLNCGFGSLLCVVVAVAAALNFDAINAVINDIKEELPELMSLLPVAVAAVTGFMASMSIVSAPSISLEGKSLWILRSLPVDPWQMLTAKVKLQLVVTQIPLLIISVTLSVVLGLEAVAIIPVVLFPQLLTMFSAALGVLLNLKFPNLDWVNEAAPVKQGASIILTMLGCFALMIVMAVVYFISAFCLGATVALYVACAAMLAATVLTFALLKKFGPEMLETL